MASSTTPQPEKAMSENEQLRNRILNTLAELGNLSVSDDSLIFEGTKFVLPASMSGKVPDAIKYLIDWEKGQEQEYEFNREYNYRPYDGAAAFQRAMKKVFGTTGIGQVTNMGIFGTYPPEYVSVPTGVNSTEQVPWGRVSFAPLNAVFNLNATRNDEHGIIFDLYVTAPKKYRAHIDAFMQVIEEELRANSIYRGKAINAAVRQPGFINTRTVDPSRVIYSDEAMRQLEANIWSQMRHADVMREVGLPLKRQVLLYGPYGTGKTLAGLLTAQVAEQNGWTYIQVRAGEDDLFGALKTAQIYAPAVVMFEDIDVIPQDTGDAVTKLLDALDSVSNKGNEVLAVFTTNHPSKLHRGLMRPGRLDAVIELAGLDAAGIQRLVRAHVPAHLLDAEVDWERVTAAFDGLLPAFAKEAANRALRYSIARTGGGLDVIGTDDLVGAAQGMRVQERMMAGAPEAGVQADLDKAFSRAIDGRLQEHVINWSGETLPIVPAGKNGR